MPAQKYVPSAAISAADLEYAPVLESKVPSTSLHKSGVSSAFKDPVNNDEIAIVNPTEKFLEVLMKSFRFNDELVEIAIIIKKI